MLSVQFSEMLSVCQQKKKSRAHSDLFKKYLLHLGLAQTWTRTHKNFLRTNLLELRLTKILLTRTQTQTQALSDFVSPSKSTHHEFVDLWCYGKILNTGASSLTALDSHPVQRILQLKVIAFFYLLCFACGALIWS